MRTILSIAMTVFSVTAATVDQDSLAWESKSAFFLKKKNWLKGDAQESVL